MYWLTPLKTIDRQFDNFVVTDGTVSCHYDTKICVEWTLYALTIGRL